MPSRRKSDSQQAPQTTEEATALVTRYVEGLSQVEQLREEADASIAAIRAARDGAIGPIEKQLKEQFLQLRAWWAVEKDQLTGGKRKSIELAGATLGDRMTTPRLVHPALKAEDVIDRLLNAGYDEMVRTKHTLDKPALIKMLRGDHAVFFQALGIDVAQREEFFVDRADDQPTDPEVVADDPEIREAKR